MSPSWSPAAAVSVAQPMASEKHASSAASAKTSSSTITPAPKLRSCVVCRQRKVRCDKQSPCSNCRRANIPCVLRSTDRPPRWARRLEHLTNNAVATNASAPQDVDAGINKVMDRVRNLEDLVKELRGQVEQAQAAASSAGGGSSGINSPESSTHDREGELQREVSPATDTSSVQKQIGRLVVEDASRSRYVSSGFWSRVNDEVSPFVVVATQAWPDGWLTVTAAGWVENGRPRPGRR